MHGQMRKSGCYRLKLGEQVNGQAGREASEWQCFILGSLTIPADLLRFCCLIGNLSIFVVLSWL